MDENITQEDGKGEVIDKICMLLLNKGLDIAEVKNKLYILFREYSVQKASTELTIYEGDVNEKILQRYIMSKTIQGCTKRTIKFYKGSVMEFINFIGKPVTEVTADDIRYFLAKKRTVDKVSKTYAGNLWRNLSAFYGWLTKEEIINKNPMLKVESIKNEKKKKKAFKEDDIEKLRDGCKNERDKCLIEVMLSTWCRVTEISNMKISDINQDGTMYVIGKGEKERIVYLNARAKFHIEKYLATRTDNEEWLFVSLRKREDRQLHQSGIEIITRELGREVGVEDCHPHRFRRTGATFALRAGMPIENVSRILGHESLETTQIYLDIDDKQVKASHEKYSR